MHISSPHIYRKCIRHGWFILVIREDDRCHFNANFNWQCKLKGNNITRTTIANNGTKSRSHTVSSELILKGANCLLVLIDKLNMDIMPIKSQYWRLLLHYLKVKFRYFIFVKKKGQMFRIKTTFKQWSVQLSNALDLKIFSHPVPILVRFLMDHWFYLGGHFYEKRKQ